MKYYAAIVLGIMGFLFTASGIYLIYDTVSFRDRAIQGEGRVTGLVLHSSSSRNRSSRSYYPVVEFSTMSGQRIEFESNSGSNPPAYTVGERVPVLYDPNQPSEARVYLSGFMFWLLPAVFSTVALLLDGLALLLYLRLRRNEGMDRPGKYITGSSFE